jgi:hypothetical protein
VNEGIIRTTQVLAMKKVRKLLAMTFIFLLSIQTLRGGSATWNLNPGSGDWNTATNWTPATVPNGPASTATFTLSNTTGVSLSAFTEVSGIVFNAGASAFTITASPAFVLTVTGAGITNNSGVAQNFVTTVDGVGHAGTVQFHNEATAGTDIAFTINGAMISGANAGFAGFFNTSTAGSSTFTTIGGAVSGAPSGFTYFTDSSSAGNGTFTNLSGVPGGTYGGFINFVASASAGNGTFTNLGSMPGGIYGGVMQFFGSATADHGTFTNDGGVVSGAGGGTTQFGVGSTGGSGIFFNNGGTVNGAGGGSTYFVDTSTAGNGTFTNNGGAAGAGTGAGATYLLGSATAGNGNFTNNGGAISGAGGGSTNLLGTSTAGNAILIANAGSGGGNGGVIYFQEDSSGGTSRFEVFGNGNLNISAHNTPGVTIGSLEGSGAVYLGSNNLTVGSNNLNTTFSGVIQDGGANGSFTKIGAGILTFEGGASNDHIGDTVTLGVVSGSTVNLNFSGNADTIGGLIVDGVAQPAGVYGSAASGAPHQLPEFAGAGTIRVVVVVPPTPTPTPGPPVITSPLVATGTVGQLFVYQFEASGATSLDVTNLAPGLTFNQPLGAIVGNPAAAGTFQVGLSATNSAGTTNATLTITVQPVPTSGPVIVNSTCATGRTGRAFSFQLQAIGGSSATLFTVDSPSLPPLGLSLDPPTGFISGIPTSDGSFSLAVSAIDGAAITHATVQLTFTSDPTVPIINSANNAILTPGQPFTYTITADANGTFGYIGTDGIVHQEPSCAGLPAGLCFDGIDTISGTFNPPFGHDGGPRTILGLSGGIVSNVQLFRIGDGGTGTFPLINFIAAKGTVNISTRLAVGTGSNVLIGGFIITGTGTTRALIRAIGPSLALPPFNIPGALQDPTLELRDGAGTLLGSNDNWRDSQETQIIAATLPPGLLAPTNDLESAILAYLSPGLYTAIVSGTNNTTGVALVEVYDLGIASPIPPDYARLANISTRGFVGTDANVIIGGFFASPQTPATSTRVVIRAIGPSLSALGVPGALQDTTLELHDGNGALIAFNDNWRTDQEKEIIATGVPPTDDHESAIVATLDPGLYTAIVAGKDNTTGVALVEVYSLQ